VELVGRNAASGSVTVSGVLRSLGSDRGTELDESYRFWHAPTNRWRIEIDGEPVYLSGRDRSLVRIDGHMTLLDGDIRLPILGRGVSPLQLLGQNSLLHSMSRDVVVRDEPRALDVGDRRAWAAVLGDRSGKNGEISIDESTGVIVRLSMSGGSGSSEVVELTEHASLPDGLFEWDGPVVEAPSPRGRRARPDPGVERQERSEVLRAWVTALDRSADVLSLMQCAESEEDAIRRLVSELGVTTVGAQAIAAMQMSRFRPDMADQLRRALADDEKNRRH
jgi:hypothetical protein